MDAATNLNTQDWYVADCPLSDAQALVKEFHYAKGGSTSAIYTHGMFRKSDNFLMGIAWWTPPTKDTALTVNASDWRRVLNLSRLVIRPEAPRNAASFLLGKSIKSIKRDKRFVSLVTFADEAQGHNGGIYKATNWLYMGRVGPHARWIDPKTERQVSNAHKNSTIMYSMGYVKMKSFYKHKFIFHLTKCNGDKKVSQLIDLVTPIESQTDEELLKRLDDLRNRREVVRPAAKARVVKEKKKVQKKAVTAAEKLLADLSPEQLAMLLEGLK